MTGLFGDTTIFNSISFSPSATRDEAQTLLDSERYADESQKAQLEWVANDATDDELEDIAQFILNNDELWMMYRTALLEGIDWGYSRKEDN